MARQINAWEGVKKFFGQLGKAVVVALRSSGIVLYDILAFLLGFVIFNPITIAVMNIAGKGGMTFQYARHSPWWRMPFDLAQDVMEWACYVLWLVGKIITFAVMLVALCITLNPITVWGIALFAPQWVAEKCYADFSEGFWPLLINIPMSWQGWIGHLLPWRCRKYFVDEDFSGASSKDRMRITIEEPRLFFQLSDSEKKIAFCRASIEQRREWMARGVEMTSPAMFIAIAHDGVDEVVEYAKRHNNQLTEDELGRILSFGDEYVATVIARLTLSDEQLLMLAKSQRNFNNVLAALRRQGCGKGVVSYIMNAVKVHVGGNAEAQVQQALTEWRQKGQVTLLRDDADGFESLCWNEALCPAAQVKMSGKQYRIFHECGRVLDEEAICSILLYGSDEMVRIIFELEEDNGLSSQKAKDIVNSSPELSNILLKVKATEAAKAEE